MDKPKKYEERLMEVIGFDEIDLEANQAGVISKRQLAKMRRTRFWWRLLLIGSLVFECFIWAFILLVASNIINMTAQATLFFLVPITIYEVVFFVYRWLKFRRFVLDIRGQTVDLTEGHVRLSLNQLNLSRRYSLWNAKTRFSLTHDLFFLFKNGDPYRIYYAPHSKRILSVEWLRDDNLL